MRARSDLAGTQRPFDVGARRKTALRQFLTGAGSHLAPLRARLAMTFEIAGLIEQTFLDRVGERDRSNSADARWHHWLSAGKLRRPCSWRQQVHWPPAARHSGQPSNTNRRLAQSASASSTSSTSTFARPMRLLIKSSPVARLSFRLSSQVPEVSLTPT